MCDFRVGDEVVCVGVPDDFLPDTPRNASNPFKRNAVYTVGRVYVFLGIQCVEIDGHPNPDHVTRGYAAAAFRKVQRRDLTAWVNQSIGNTDKLDKRQPKKVRA